MLLLLLLLLLLMLLLLAAFWVPAGGNRKVHPPVLSGSAYSAAILDYRVNYTAPGHVSA